MKASSAASARRVVDIGRFVNDDVKTLKATPKATPKEILLALINHNNKVTIPQIAAAWGINKRNAQNRINQYVDEGLIRRIGSARGGYWEIC